MLANYIRGRTTLLLTVLVLFLVLFPYLTGRVGRIFLSLLYIGIPVAGIHAVSGTRRHATIAFVLGLPAIAAALQIFFEPAAVPRPLAPISSAVFYAYATVTILMTVMRSRKVTVDTIYGVISVYLLIGFTWMSLYAMLEQFAPGSFSVGTFLDDRFHLGEFLYV